ncbi:hypothetical protein FHS07_001045 [Microbacterium proteolyticum]|uniref:Uncharacterized protein n=1 Tax=Microbacterium proteolyticum TaxID=1572644 RepID=A0A7W5GEU0_9MICO|nr:hypothetical protein [Microbacterium proteolyticum]MBB3157361.1 hypothetical protein [Microbacterium proteolyticum]
MSIGLVTPADDAPISGGITIAYPVAPLSPTRHDTITGERPAGRPDVLRRGART